VRIEEFKAARLLFKVRAATVNRDLAVLRRMLGIAERKRLIRFPPFREIEMLEERKERRQPHILTFDEEKGLLATAADHIRALAILILETGLRSGKEALALKWADVDFLNESIRVRQSKTIAGQRIVPISSRCNAELLRWQALFGPNFSEYVFPKPGHPETHLRDVRAAWTNALLAAGLSNKQIAAELYLSIATVERHLATVYRNLGLGGRVEAARFAMENGLSGQLSPSR